MIQQVVIFMSVDPLLAYGIWGIHEQGAHERWTRCNAVSVVSGLIDKRDSYNAILLLIPFVVLPKPTLRSTVSPRTGRCSPPSTHEACATWRQKKRITTPCALFCRAFSHIGHVLLPVKAYREGTRLQQGTLIPVRKNPLVWLLCSLRDNCMLSLLRIA